MSVEYYFHDGENQTGPFSEDELKPGSLDENIYVWANGMASWITIIEIPELAAYIKQKKIPPPFTNVIQSEKLLFEDPITLSSSKQPPEFAKEEKTERKLIEPENSINGGTISKNKYYSLTSYGIGGILFANPLALGIFHSHNLRTAGLTKLAKEILIACILVTVLPLLFLVYLSSKSHDTYTISKFVGLFNIGVAIMIAIRGKNELKKQNIDINPAKDGSISFISPWKWFGILILCFLPHLIVGTALSYKEENKAEVTNAVVQVNRFNSDVFHTKADSLNIYNSLLGAKLDSMNYFYSNDSKRRYYAFKAGILANQAISLCDTILAMNLLPDSYKDFTTDMRAYNHNFYLMAGLLYKKEELEGTMYGKKLDSLNRSIRLLKASMKKKGYL